MTDSQARHSFGFALLLLSVGTVGWTFARSTRAIPVSPGDPGPWLLPCTLSTVLLVAGLLEVYLAWRDRRLRPRVAGPDSMMSGAARVAAMMIASIAYGVAFVSVGFVISTFCFVSGAVAVLGSRLWVSLLVASATVAFIHVLFTRFFLVALPEPFFH
jgi:hypothetical protein